MSAESLTGSPFKAYWVVASLKPFLMVVLYEINTRVFPVLQIQCFPFMLSPASFVCGQNLPCDSQFVAVNHVSLEFIVRITLPPVVCSFNFLDWGGGAKSSGFF